MSTQIHPVTLARRQSVSVPVTLLPGDGIGPEIAEVTRRVLTAAGAPLDYEVCAAGASVFGHGVASGVPDETVESIARTGLVLKGPLETPIGHGGKSANVTLRKLFETYANVRPAREYPGVPTPFSGRGIDLVIVRENVEDLYAGIEHMQTPSVAQCLKLVSRTGCERIVRLAFEVARSEGRASVTCATKANIMKLTEGLLQRTFEEIAQDYPEIEARHMLVDNCAHQLVRRPEQFDVIVTSNMNGDILSDLASGLVGGLGFAPSANLGAETAIFEAVHGSAPDLAGLDVANPTSLLLSSVMLLRFIGSLDVAGSVEAAVLSALEDGQATRDAGGSLGTTAFGDAVIERLGSNVPERDYTPLRLPARERVQVTPSSRHTVGVDVFVESLGRTDELAASISAAVDGTPLTLKMISNRGTQVHPASGAMPDLVDHFRCRLVARADGVIDDGAILAVLGRIGATHRWMHVEKLEEHDGQPGFTKAHGEDR
jgi:isocitrate dehydrogenase